ncbi:MAG: hypothetical protein J0H39_13990 [Alphaproteobacteria bacterium]|nr:hypothetical protein [Alphaproteobacteria bacterium]
MTTSLLGGLDDPKTAALLGFAAPLMQAGGWSAQPVSLGQALGAALQNGMASYGQYRQARRVGELQDLQIADAKRQSDDRAARRGAYDALFAAPKMPETMTGGPTRANAAALPPSLAQQMGFSPAEIETLRALGPDAGMQMVAQRTLTKREPIKLSAGDTLLDPLSKAPIFTAPAKPNAPNSFETALSAAGLQPGTPEYQKAARDYVTRLGTPPGTTVTIDQKQDGAEASDYGKALVDEYKTVRERGNAANDARNQLAMARTIATTGPDGRELPSALQMQIGNAAAALGFNTESPAAKQLLGRVTDGQAFVGTMQNLVLTKMQAQKGPQTENDAKRIESTVSSLGNTPAARDFLLRSADALAQLDQYQHQFWEEYRASSPKKSFEGAAIAWRDWRNKTPLLGVNPNSNLPVFLPEFMEKARDANPNVSDGEILNQWRVKYGRR